MKSFPTVDYRPAELAMWWRRRLGTVFPTWLGRRFVYLLGPKANEFVLANDRLFQSGRRSKG
ncbi:hypothetical protein HJ590_14295 [Naumannella sp. ID2617S]|nr:hypothetical protein [Naumannella sp. ID2617S]